MKRPEYLIQGEQARLFPVLSTTSKEGRTTSILLACMSKIEELGAQLLASVGQKVGKRSTLETFTEIVFRGEKNVLKDRPDGLLIVKSGAKEWRALIEAKIGTATLSAEQVEKYRLLAKSHKIDCVITVSNQFATVPSKHPLEEVRKSRSKIPVYHWSWMFVLTTADLLLSNDEVDDDDQRILLSELSRFLVHESAGIKGFDRMPPEWSELNRLVSAGGNIPAKSSDAMEVLDAWHQETKDLSLVLSRQTETAVYEKLSRKHLHDPVERMKSELKNLRENNCLIATLQVPGAAAPLEIVADMNRRSIEVGMSLRAPEDKKSSRARLNWLLRQVKSDQLGEAFVRLNWPGRSETTHFAVPDLLENVSICEANKDGLQVLGFHLYLSRRLGARFTQQVNFIKELEDFVPFFYREFGQNLAEWRKPAPKIRDQTPLVDDEADDEDQDVSKRNGDDLGA